MNTITMPTASAVRAIDYATRDHRTARRTTTVGQRSNRGKVLRHQFVHANEDADDRLDAPYAPRPLNSGRIGRRRALRYRLLSQFGEAGTPS